MLGALTAAIVLLAGLIGSGSDGSEAGAQDAGEVIGPGVRDVVRAGADSGDGGGWGAGPMPPIVVMLESRAGGGTSDTTELRQATAAAVAAVTDAGIDGLEITRDFDHVPAIVVDLADEAALDELAALPVVRRIDLDSGGTGSLASALPVVGMDTSHVNGWTGEGTTVAVFDTGIDTNHPDLVSDIVHQECFGWDGGSTASGYCPNGTERQSGTGAAEDDAGHGTHVNGIVSSDGAVASVGGAPAADLTPVKVLDDCSFSGCFSSFTENIVAAADWVIANHATYGIDVISMSLSTSAAFPGNCDASTSWTMAGATAFTTLRNLGITSFAAAGNEGTTSMGAPGCLSSVISVGASTDADAAAGFSNANAETDIFAPGVSIVSDAIGGGTTSASGTSMATPLAAACAALLLESGTATTPAQIQTRLETSPVSITSQSLSFPRIDCEIPTIDATDSYTALQPTRILDSRSGVGLSGTWAAKQTRDLQVVGEGNVPAGATAVVLNVTATDATAASNLRVWPTGQALPNASNLNFEAGQTIPNLVIVKLGTGGKVSIRNQAGQTHVLADVVGYFGPAGSRYTGLVPSRILDSRSGNGLSGKWTAGQTRALQVTGRGNVPAGATAVVINLTATGPTAASNLRAWPAGEAQPNVSNLNFTAGQTIPNLAVVKLSSDGRINIRNQSGETHVLGDVVGYFGSGGDRYGALRPSRVLDSRTGNGLSGTWAAGQTRDLQVVSRGGVPADATAVVLNVTVTNPSAASDLRLWPTGEAQPNVSNLNFSAGQTIPNLVVVKIGNDGNVSLRNQSGTTDVIADVVGYFAP